MSEVNIHHGQEVRADLTGVRVGANSESWFTTAEPNGGVIFFCTMGSIRIREVLQNGDGAALPHDVVLEGLTVPEPGTYDILNAIVHSNGSLRVIADANTRVVPTVREFDRSVYSL